MRRAIAGGCISRRAPGEQGDDMSASVLAVWLDGAEADLLEEMMDEGELPALTSLRNRGMYGRLQSLPYSVAETVYGLALTGQWPEQTGNWLVCTFDPRSYRIKGRRAAFGGTPVFLPQD